MNYLAHAYLADVDDDFMLGSFMGDFVKGTIADRYPPSIKAGIAFHRKIDRFADAHAKSRSSRNLFPGRRRRYAGVILDICYDHFLSRHWHRFAEPELTVFIARIYQVLKANEAILPMRLKTVIPRMQRENWLACYDTLDGVQLTLARIAKRLRDENALDGAMEDIRQNYEPLEKNFFIFFLDLKAYANACIMGADEKPFHST